MYNINQCCELTRLNIFKSPYIGTYFQKQAEEEQVSSNHELTFVMAAVAVGVWCEHPDLGELLLAHFHIKCPYLVPYYQLQREGQSSMDYYL